MAHRIKKDLRHDGTARFPAYLRQVFGSGKACLSNRALVVEVLLLWFVQAAPAGMVNPGIDNINREWCYLAKSTTVIGVPYMPDAIQVTFDGALFTRRAELCFFCGNSLKPVMDRQKTYLDGWIPIVEEECKSGAIDYHIEMFGAVLERQTASNTLQFVRVQMTNTGRRASRAVLVSALRHSGGDCRYFALPFDVHSTYVMTNRMVLQNGRLVYTFARGAREERVPGLAYRGPFRGISNYVTARAEVCLARYALRLAPHQSRELVFKMPRVPVKATDTVLVQEIQRADYNFYRERTVEYWTNLLDSGAQFDIPEARVNQAWRAGLVHLMLATRSRDGQRFQTSGLPYPEFFMGDFADMALAYDFTGHFNYTQQSFPQIFARQYPDGLFCDTSLSHGKKLWASHGQMIYTLAHHCLMTRDAAYARKAVLPHLRAAIDWLARARSKDVYGLMPPAWPYDNEMIQGHYTSHNLWGLLGLRTAVRMARWLGLTNDAWSWRQLQDAYYASFTNALAASVATDGPLKGYVPTGLYRFRAGPSVGWPWYNTDNDWQNMLLCYPTEVLPRSDWRVRATLRVIRREDYHEGIMSYRHGMHLHQYLTANMIEQYNVLGEARQALIDYYSFLLHAGSTFEGFENMVKPWSSRLLQAPIPPPHAWAAAEMVLLTRNMLVVEYGGRAGMDPGQRDLYLFNVLSPAWAVPGHVVAIRNAPTEMGPITAQIRFAANGARITIASRFYDPPHKLVVRIPWFVKLSSFHSDAAQAVREGQTIRLSPDATELTLKWRVRPHTPDRTFQDLLLAYRREVPFWNGPRTNAPPPPPGFLTPAEEHHPPAVLSFATVLAAYRHEYARRYAIFLAHGGKPTPIVAPPMLTARERKQDFEKQFGRLATHRSRAGLRRFEIKQLSRVQSENEDDD